MTALAQGCAGLALVMGFALLVCGQMTAAAILLAAQGAAVAVTAVVLHQPLMAVPPLVLAIGVWVMRLESPDPRTPPAGGAKLGIGIGAVLAILCQSLGSLALPSAIVLLAVLLAATRSGRLMQVVALVALQNGLTLAGCLTGTAAPLPAALIFPIACLVLPLPLAADLLISAMRPRARGQPKSWVSWMRAWTTPWLGWIDLGVALAIVAATLVAQLHGLAAIFAPLLALDGVMRSWLRRTRPALHALRRGAALAQTGFTVLAVCAPSLMTAWLALLAAMAMALLPALSRRWDGAVLAFLAAGLALFGILLLPATPPILGWFSLLAGFAAIAAVIPDLTVALVVLILRLADQASLPPVADALGTAIAVLALLACALLLIHPVRRYRRSLLLLGQASIALLIICTGLPEGRFAGLVLLILLVLSRTAARITAGPAAELAMAGLGGVPPLGVFPGLVLVALTLSTRSPWLLLPLGAGLLPLVLASLPRRLPDLSPRLARPSIAWLPLLLTVLAGYCAPDQLVQWWRILTGGPS